MNASVNSTPCIESRFRSDIGNIGSPFQIMRRNYACKNRQQIMPALHKGMNAKVSVASAFGSDFRNEELWDGDIVNRVGHVMQAPAPLSADGKQIIPQNFGKRMSHCTAILAVRHG